MGRACLFLAHLCCLVLAVTANFFDTSGLPLETVVVRSGENVTLPCPGISELSLVTVLEWKCYDCLDHRRNSSLPGTHLHHQTKLIEFNSNAVVVWQRQERLTLDPRFGLQLTPVQTADQGDYLCLVNERRRPETIISLRVLDVPDAPGRPLVGSFTSRSVSLSWAPSINTHGSPITHYIIQTRVGEDGEWDESNTQLTSTNATVFDVSGLEPFTVYSFRVIAVNAQGPSAPGRESYFIVTLREVPDGKPHITSAHNTSSSSIFLTWQPPPKSSIHGEFLGYRLAYKKRDAQDDITETYLRDPATESYAIQGLEVFSQYVVSLQVFNPEGLGPSTTVIVMTDEGAPGKPENVTVNDVTDSSISVSWEEPREPNGVLKGYRIFFMHKNYTDVHTIRSTEKSQTYVLTSLAPFTEYKLWLKAYTTNHEGEPSDPIIIETDVRGPGAPRISNLTCHTDDTLFLQWHRPTVYNKSIDFYYIYYRREDEWEFEELVITTTADRLDHSMFLPNLTMNIMYEIKIRAATKSNLQTDKLYYGQYSESRKIIVAADCDRQALTSDPEHLPREVGVNAGLVAALVCASFALILVVIAFVLWRKYFQAAYYYLDDGPPNTPPLTNPPWDGGTVPAAVHIITVEDGADPDSEAKSSVLSAKGPVPVSLFLQHVGSLHADGDIGFSKEYEAIQTAVCKADLGSEHSLSEENKPKNRYLNIVAYDHSRVQLRTIPGQKRSTDYINANFIDGFQQCRAYIGTQGPLPATFDAFWRMVWEQRVSVIVMITNLVERGRRKCDMYWPKEGSETYGFVQVRLLSEEVMATYTLRTFTIKHLKLKRKKSRTTERTVLQYHYTNWPDHGTPEHPLPILSFVRQSAASNPVGAGPIVVHCSAGVGRTGTYIVLDAMLKQIRAKEELNVCGFLCHIRNQRNFLVQTEEQYIFIHDALAEAIQSAETNIHRSQLSKYVQLLQGGLQPAVSTTIGSVSPDGSGSSAICNWQLLDHQFQLATDFVPKEFHLASSAKACNVSKIRNAALVPVETGRVYLTPKPGIEGSDYINASWLQGYNKLKEFIVTQHPLDGTISDFWQMLWDHNSQTVVVLSDTSDDEFPVFWPLRQADVEFENFRIRFIDEQQIALPDLLNTSSGTEASSSSGDKVTQIEVAAQSLQDDYELRVRIIYCPGWPHRGAADPDLAALFRLPTLVINSHQQYQNGPIVVVDRFGGTEASTLCCLTTLLKQMRREQHVDVYMYAKLYHSKRPNVWSNRDDYVFLYRCVEALHHHLPRPVSPTPTIPSSFSLPLQLNCQLSVNGCGVSLGDSLSLTSLPTPNGDVVVRVPPEGMEEGCVVDVV